MNDFTKDELEELLQGYQMHSHNTRHNWPSLELCKKLQSMIDNYCEHDDKCEHDWGVGFGSIYSPVIYCKTCNCQKPQLSTYIFKKIMGMNE